MTERIESLDPLSSPIEKRPVHAVAAEIGIIAMTLARQSEVVASMSAMPIDQQRERAAEITETITDLQKIANELAEALK